MTLKLFLSKDELINTSTTLQELSENCINKHDIFKAKITHKVDSHAVANITLYDINNPSQYKYCALLYNSPSNESDIIFIGQITKIDCINNQVILEAKSKVCDKKIIQAFDHTPIHDIFKPNKKTNQEMIHTDSKMNVRNLCDKENLPIKQFILHDSAIYSKQISYHNINSNTSEIDFHISWIKQQNIDVDLSDALPLNEKTTKELSSTLPHHNSQFNDYIVRWENEDNEKTEKIEDFKLHKNYEQKCKEIWKLKVNLPNLNNYSVYVDAQKNLQTHVQWEVNQTYNIGDIVLKDRYLYQCIHQHAADLQFNKNYWILWSNQVYDDTENKLKSDSLFDHMDGKNIFDNILNILYCNAYKNSYDCLIEVTCPWQYWNNIDVLDKVKLTLNGKPVLAKVRSYNKIYQYDSKKIKLELMVLTNTILQHTQDLYIVDENNYIEFNYFDDGSNMPNLIYKKNEDNKQNCQPIDIKPNPPKLLRGKSSDNDKPIYGIQIIDQYITHEQQISFDIYQKGDI